MEHLHAKQKGTLGELAIAQDLISNGYAVFTELGDLSKVDLIALVPIPVKIQVKSLKSTNGAIELSSRKSGPNYRFRYTEQDVDIFAVYVYDRNIIAYIACKELLENSRMMTLRIDKPKNNQHKARRIDDYRDFQRALRDYTGNIPPSNVGDDEIVQTTTKQ